MQFKNLDEIDRQILKYLSENGRLSHAELGRLVGLTRAAVRERVSQLVEHGIISNFTIVVNPLKAGKNLSIYFNIDVEWSKMDQIAETLLNSDEITNVYQMSGKPHLHVHALFDNQEHVSRYAQQLREIDGIQSVESEFLITRYKERGALLI
ncbi:Lrp/AsnC family transcriptional regulator [Anaerosinus massiliensis]|uniref:Lrp/AsnC family transcriptional regulator n=1 Tax=Massilibacillus massiliensis TaxID=1806837 RepID=UPI000DA606AD|nr:Lrp/AsnC family transcriptional regulator [Massilibacillus massiliensis]